MVTLVVQPIEVGDSTSRVVRLGNAGAGAESPTLVVADPANGCAFTINSPELGDAGSVVGINPAVSPDGAYLAYVRVGATEGQNCARQDLVVRDMESGAERSWLAAWDGGGFSTGHITSKLQWSPDSRRLAFGTYDAKLFVLDPEGDRGTTIRDARLIRDHRAGLQYPIWADSGRLLVKDVAGGPDLRSPLVEIDLESGYSLTTLISDVGLGAPIRYDERSGKLFVLRPIDPVAGDDSLRSQVVAIDTSTQSVDILLEGGYVDAA